MQVGLQVEVWKISGITRYKAMDVGFILLKMVADMSENSVGLLNMVLAIIVSG